MAWKDWSYWVKGGIIFTLLSLIGFLLRGYLLKDILTNSAFDTIFVIIYLPIYLLKNNVLYYYEPGLFSSFLVLSLIYTFFVGALIGWLYGKIKNRNAEKVKDK